MLCFEVNHYLLNLSLQCPSASMDGHPSQGTLERHPTPLPSTATASAPAAIPSERPIPLAEGTATLQGLVYFDETWVQRECTRRRGRRPLALPPYRPDDCPIEYFFIDLKLKR